MKLVLGVDAGGSCTIAWLGEALSARDYRVLGRGQAGAGNAQTQGVAAAVASIDDAVASAFDDASVARTTVESACLAVAGAGRSQTRLQVMRWASESGLADRVQVVHDARPIVAKAFETATGVALIAGTGSLAYGRDSSGREARCGGWGYLLGDEGGGYAIALAGLRSAVRAADGRGPRTSLLAAFLEHLGCTAVSELMEAIYDPHVSQTTIASMARVVFATAVANDAVAESIVLQGAAELAQMVHQVARQLYGDARDFPLALTGGLLINQSRYRSDLQQALMAVGAVPNEVVTVAAPVAGAVVMACEHLARINGTD